MRDAMPFEVGVCDTPLHNAVRCRLLCDDATFTDLRPLHWAAINVLRQGRVQDIVKHPGAQR
jgi:hypothetical protein